MPDYIKITPLVYIRETHNRIGKEAKETMSEEGDPFWASLFERIIGLSLIVIGAVLLYLTVTNEGISGFSMLFGFLSIVLVIVGIFLLLIKPEQ